MSKLKDSSEPPLLTPARLWTLFIVQTNEAYQITMLYPFVVFMIRDFGTSEHSVGMYSGLLSGSFCIAQFCSSFGWGWFSDVHGRKLALLIGLFFGMLAMFSLGLSKSYGQALACRIIGGFFNGNLGVMKSYIADITNESNRTYAFSTMIVGWGFGSVLASLASGLLCDLPFWIFSEKYNPSKYSFPYLLPCAIGSLIAFTAMMLCILFVQDVDKLLANRNKYSNSNSNGLKNSKSENRYTTAGYDDNDDDSDDETPDERGFIKFKKKVPNMVALSTPTVSDDDDGDGGDGEEEENNNNDNGNNINREITDRNSGIIIIDNKKQQEQKQEQEQKTSQSGDTTVSINSNSNANSNLNLNETDRLSIDGARNSNYGTSAAAARSSTTVIVRSNIVKRLNESTDAAVGAAVVESIDNYKYNYNNNENNNNMSSNNSLSTPLNTDGYNYNCNDNDNINTRTGRDRTVSNQSQRIDDEKKKNKNNKNNKNQDKSGSLLGNSILSLGMSISNQDDTLVTSLLAYSMYMVGRSFVDANDPNGFDCQINSVATKAYYNATKNRDNKDKQNNASSQLGKSGKKFIEMDDHSRDENNNNSNYSKLNSTKDTDGSDILSSNFGEFLTLNALFSQTFLVLAELSYALCAAAFIVYDELLPIFCAELVKYGGLGFSSFEIGVILAIQGIVLVIWTFKIQLNIIKSFGLLFSSKISTIVGIFVFILTPTLSLINDLLPNGEKLAKGYLMLCMIALTMPKQCSGSLVFTSSICFVNNSVPPNQVGKANGLGQTFASLVRGLGPSFAGILWSWSTTQNWTGRSYTAYALAVILMIILFGVWIKIPKHLEKPWESQPKQLRLMRVKR